MDPEDVEVGVAEKSAVDEKEQDAVEEKESEVDEDTGGEVFDVDLDADTGCDITDDGFCHSVDADGLVGEGVLKQTDGGAGESAGDGVSAGDGEEDRDDEREIEDSKLWKGPGEEGLQQDGTERHQQGNGWGEAVLFELSAGCVTAGGHKGGCLLLVTSLLGGLVTVRVEGLEVGSRLFEVVVLGASLGPAAGWLALSLTDS